MWVVFIGAPGCGKGTQAGFLSGSHGFTVISVGDILRNNKETLVADDGRTVGEIISTGSLLPDSVIVSLVNSELEKTEHVGESDILFDGVPRTVKQAEALSELAAAFGAKIDYVLDFEVNHDLITKRILGRFECSGCGMIYNDFFSTTRVDGVCDACGGKEFYRRSDDNEESLKRRLSEYNAKTLPLIGFYDERSLLHRIDASRSVDDVRSGIETVLKLVERKSKEER
ncbi:MAG: nucleoside monophosphate kinase [Holosporales bacterium]|nr:nucleoside monophosphate kinase [Holosporales bacterium]